MTEFRTDKAIVRIHGKSDRETIESATIRYLKGVQKCKRKEREKSKAK